MPCFILESTKIWLSIFDTFSRKYEYVIFSQISILVTRTEIILIFWFFEVQHYANKHVLNCPSPEIVMVSFTKYLAYDRMQTQRVSLYLPSWLIGKRFRCRFILNSDEQQVKNMGNMIVGNWNVSNDSFL